MLKTVMTSEALVKINHWKNVVEKQLKKTTFLKYSRNWTSGGELPAFLGTHMDC